MSKENTPKPSFWKRLWLSPTLAEKTLSQRIAYIGVVAAFVTVANTFEFKLFDTQFSLTLFASALSGVLLGPLFGFVACFVGDLVGFFANSSGFAYMPWVGIAMGMTSLIFGVVVNGISTKRKGFFFLKLGAACVLSFLVSTVAINTTAFWLLYSKVTYWQYLVTRLFVGGQIWSSLINYVLLFVALPALSKIKPLHIRL